MGHVPLRLPTRHSPTIPASRRQMAGMVHQHKRANPGAEPLRQFGHPSKDRPAITIPAEESSPAIPTAHHVTPTNDEVDAKRSCRRAALIVRPKLRIARD